MGDFNIYAVISLLRFHISEQVISEQCPSICHASEVSVSTSCQRLNAFGSSFIDKHAYPAFTLANVNIWIYHER